jgi:hypothetical protein
MNQGYMNPNALMSMYGNLQGLGAFAMGGQVNYPQGLRKNMGNMPIFAMGGETQGESMPLKDKYNNWLNAKPVTKYASGGMPPHPKVGMNPLGNVPTKSGDINVENKETLWKVGEEQFVGTKRRTEDMLKRYKERDKLALASEFNSTERDKAKKEAEDQQKAAIQEQKAQRAMTRMMGKYGGAIQRMMARGGMINKYDLGGGTGGLNVNNPGLGSYNLPSSFSQDYSTPVAGPLWNAYGRPSLFKGIPQQPPTPAYNVPGGIYPNQVPYAIESSADSWRTGPTNPVTGVSNYLSTMGQQAVDATNAARLNNKDVTIPTYARSGVDADGNPVSINPNMPSGYIPPGYEAKGGADGDMSNFGNQLETAAMLGPGLYNLGMGLFSKPEKFDKLKLSGQLKSYEAPYQTDYAPYYATKYALRQAGQSSPAALSQLFATFSKQEAANRLANREQNLRRQMAADQFNLSRADQVAQTNLAIDQLNAQQRAARRSMIGEGISNIGQIAAYNKGMRQDKDVLGDLYKNYEFKDGKWAYKR